MKRKKSWYRVCAYIWHEGDETPSLCLMGEYENHGTAMYHMRVAPVNDLYPQWNLYRDDGDSLELIARKDEYGINTEDL